MPSRLDYLIWMPWSLRLSGFADLPAPASDDRPGLPHNEATKATMMQATVLIGCAAANQDTGSHCLSCWSGCDFSLHDCINLARQTLLCYHLFFVAATSSPALVSKGAHVVPAGLPLYEGSPQAIRLLTEPQEPRGRRPAHALSTCISA